MCQFKASTTALIVPFADAFASGYFYCKLWQGYTCGVRRLGGSPYQTPCYIYGPEWRNPTVQLYMGLYPFRHTCLFPPLSSYPHSTDLHSYLSSCRHCLMPPTQAKISIAVENSSWRGCVELHIFQKQKITQTNWSLRHSEKPFYSTYDGVMLESAHI
jgi:hypothetical protein